LLDDWGGIDKAKAIQYIRNCRSFDGGFSLIPGQEGHGGSTFCAVASLTLMGEMDSMFGSEGNVSSLSSWRGDLIRWCVSRQVKGLQGRPNKHEDTCYSYWIGGTLRLLDCDHLLNRNLLDDFVLECQTDLGGFSKLNGGYHPDLLHSFYSLAWLSLSCDRFEDQSVEDRSDDLNLKPFECALGICRERLKAIKSL
jgi:geranylgeranyl transferase type-1 subunit beta